jgi:hypothetical protein
MYWQVGRLQWCWAHLKRDFQAMIDRGNPRSKWLGDLGRLEDVIEHRGGRGTGVNRGQERQRVSLHVITSMGE